MIVGNDVGPAAGTFGGDHNEVTIVSRDGAERWPRLSKAEVARRLVAVFAARLAERPS